MARLSSAKCPNCGAAISLAAEQETVTCSYCSMSFPVAERASTGPTSDAGRIIRVEAGSAGSSGTAGALGVVGVVVAVFIAVVVAVVMADREGRTAAEADQARSAGEGEADPASAVEQATGDQLREYGVRAERRPLLADVNGDQIEDLVVLFSLEMNGQTGWRYAAFNGKDGELVWATKSIGKDEDKVVAAVAEGWLLLANEAGQLDGVQLKNGVEAWSTALGDQAEKFCAGPEPNTVVVVTKDERQLVVDVRSGGQKSAAAGATCQSIPDNRRVRHRILSLPTEEPKGQEGKLDEYRCGSARLMTPDGLQIINDPCTKLIGFDGGKVEGYSIGKLYRFGEGTWITHGIRQPGTAIPMVGLAKGGKLVWKLEVPDGNPMAAEKSGTERVAVLGSDVVAAYMLKEKKGWHLTAIDGATGKRRWDIALSTGDSPVYHTLLSGKSLYVATYLCVVAVDQATGKQRFVIGWKGRKQPRVDLPK